MSEQQRREWSVRPGSRSDVGVEGEGDEEDGYELQVIRTTVRVHVGSRCVVGFDSLPKSILWT